MATTKPRQIVLARMERAQRRPSGKAVKRDGQLFPDMKMVGKPHALFWRKKELKGDLRKAEKYASRWGYEVLVYPRATKNALEKAKAHLRKRQGGNV